jgi:hypothetical protein
MAAGDRERGLEMLGEAEGFAHDFYGRVPGSDAERRAARRLEDGLRAQGRDVVVETFPAWPNWPLAHALHAIAAVVGSVLSVRAPAPGAALVLAATLLTFLDAAGLVPTTRRLLGRRWSQNVVSWGEREAAGVLLLAAHYDAGRASLMRSERWESRRAALGRIVRRQIGPLEPFFWALCLLLACCLLRLTGLEGTLLSAIQFVPTVTLVVAVPLFLDVALSPPELGDNENASGVALALGLAERLAGRLEHFELHLLLSGSQKAVAGGCSDFLRRYRGALDRERVVFLNLDQVGAGTVRYSSREGALVTFASHRQLVRLCAGISEDVPESDARPVTGHGASDAYAARSAGFPSITITCRDERDLAPQMLDPAALARAEEFCTELILRVDAELGPLLPGAGRLSEG